MPKYVIVCLRHRDMFFGGDVHLFWGWDRSGYTAVLERAGLYSFEEALKIADEDDVPIDIAALGKTEDFFEPMGDRNRDVSGMNLLTLMYMSKDNKVLINKSREQFRDLKEERICVK